MLWGHNFYSWRHQKNLPNDSNYIVNVVIWTKFGFSRTSAIEVIKYLSIKKLFWGLCLVQARLFGTGTWYGFESLHQCGKWVKNKSMKFLANSYVCRSYMKKTGRGSVLDLPILNRVYIARMLNILHINFKEDIATYNLKLYQTSTKLHQLIYSWAPHKMSILRMNHLNILKICPPNITLLERTTNFKNSNINFS